MKKMFTILTAVLVGAFAYAQHGWSVLNFKLFNNQNFVIWVNGQQASGLNNRATIDNIRTGKNRITIAVPEYNRMGMRQMVTIYSGWVNIAPNKVIFASLDRFSDFYIQDMFAIRRGNHGGWNNPNNNYFPTCDNQDYYYNNYGQVGTVQPQLPVLPSAPQRQIIDALSFQQLKETINKTAFEQTKQSVLNQAAGNFWFTTHQVKELIGLFSFESTKLEAAKKMYDRTVDPQNYFAINQVFSFSSSVNDLSQYLAQR